MSDKKVTVYSQTGCANCKKVKEYLLQKGVTYTEKNISTDPGAVKEMRRLGVMTLPVTLINTQTVVGFDQEKLDEMLSR